MSASATELDTKDQNLPEKNQVKESDEKLDFDIKKTKENDIVTTVS